MRPRPYLIIFRGSIAFGKTDKHFHSSRPVLSTSRPENFVGNTKRNLEQVTLYEAVKVRSTKDLTIVKLWDERANNTILLGRSLQNIINL